jgi:prepilin signal peptidase PulO-like enzyme (type II secretory pathway)
MIVAILFVLGLVFGSFGYVLALRYDGDHFLLDPKIVGGRSYCPHCRKVLRWFELIPVISFVVQGGQCRNCKARIGFAYPVIELFSGLLFVAVAARVQDFYGIMGPDFWICSALWIAFFFALLLLSIIDIRLGIIPDEFVVALCAIAVCIAGFSAAHFSGANISFFGSYGVFFGLQGNIWINHAIGALAGMLFFGGLVALTRGKGMGIGDVKLAIPLGFLFGWPDILFLTAFAFVSGAAIGLGYISMGKKTMKSALPFGPFLAFGAVFIFFMGFGFMNWYLHAMGL